MSGKPEVYYFFKGRVALYAVLKAMGLGPGDEVIMPGFTCVVVPNAVRYLGAKPVFIDVDPETYNIDPGKISSSEGELWHSGRARAVIAQHTFGIPADMDGITEVARAHGMTVIEDSCHALGSIYRGRKVGNIGDVAFFSSQWSKPMTTGLGGWARVSDPELAKKVGAIYPEFSYPSMAETSLLVIQYLAYQLLFTPSLFWFARGALRTLAGLGLALGSSSADELRGELPPGYKKRMSRWQKDLLMRKFRDLEDTIAHRRSLAVVYEGVLEELGLEAVTPPEGSDPVYLRYPIKVNDKPAMLARAKRARIELGDWFLSPVHPLTGGFERVGYREGMCPVSERLCRTVVNLPTHERVGLRDIEKIVEFLRKTVKV